MTDPQLIFEAAFAGGASTGTYLHLSDPARGILGTATLGPEGGVWQDLSAYVRSASFRRGANRVTSPILRYEAGTCTVELNDPDRRFDPTNTAGPYTSGGVTQVTPMRAVRLLAVWDGITYELFRGFADAWTTKYDGGPLLAYCELTATDGVRVLSNVDRAAVPAEGAGDDSGARVHRILDSVLWSDSDRIIAVGDTTHQATTLDGTAWQELTNVQDTEIGEIYVDAGGRVVFRNRQALAEDIRSASAVARFGDTVSTDNVETTVNLATNPSVEIDTVGWVAGGSVPPTLARSNTRAMFDTWSLLVTWGVGGFVPLAQYSVAGLTIGKTYTATLYVYVPTGSPDVIIALAGTGFGTNTAGVRDAWVRLSYSGVAATAGWDIQVWPLSSPAGGETVYVDGVQCEEGAATTYCDGEQASCEWDGTAHASTSRRLPELPYADVKLAYDAETIANSVRITRVGGTEQTAADAASQTLYLTQTFVRNDLTMQDDSSAARYAEFILYQAKDPELRFTDLVVNPRIDEAGLYPHILGRQIGDRIRVIRRPPGTGTVVRECFIRGMTLDIKKGAWIATWALQSATKWSFLTLDHTTLGVLDSNAMSY